MFKVDKQTLNDLEIFEVKGVENSIFKFFDRTISHGGREELKEMFNRPLSHPKTIRDRQDAIRYVQEKKHSFAIDRYLMSYIEYYLLIGNKPVKLSRLNAWHKAFKYWLKPTNEYYLIQRGIKHLIAFLQELYTYSTEDTGQKRPYLVEKHSIFIAESIKNTALQQVIETNAKKRISIMNRERFDYIFRYCAYDRITDILHIVYQLDVFQALANTAAEHGWVFPEISESRTIKITGLYHPFVKNAVSNNITLNEDENMLFVTGANMAGKSTFLKAFGVSVYLAHMGFPVAASSMQTSVFNGLFSTINITDDLHKGYSHFYNEVLRIKSIAEEVNSTKNLVVIFDELFRGTNVKDAFDASLAIVSAFAKVKGSIFLISTHIIEIAEQLRKWENIRFSYFHTAIMEKTPIYSYRLYDGVTEERIGMLIIENEQIIERITGEI